MAKFTKSSLSPSKKGGVRPHAPLCIRHYTQLLTACSKPITTNKKIKHLRLNSYQDFCKSVLIETHWKEMHHYYSV